MDKEQKPVVDLFIKQTLGPVVFRTVGHLILGEMKKYRNLNSNKFVREDDFWADMVKGKYKQSLITYTNHLKTQTDDLMAEIMKQYGMDKFSDSTDYHDIFSQMFNDGLGIIKEALEIGHYDIIVKLSEMSEDGSIERFKRQ